MSSLSISYVSSVSTHVAFLATATQIYFRVGISCTCISNSTTYPRLRTIWNLVFPLANVFRISSVHHWSSIVLRRIKISRIVNLNHIYLSFISIMSTLLVFLLLLRCVTSRRAGWSKELLRWIITNDNVFLRNTTITRNFSSPCVILWIWVGLSATSTIWMF